MPHHCGRYESGLSLDQFASDCADKCAAGRAMQHGQCVWSVKSGTVLISRNWDFQGTPVVKSVGVRRNGLHCITYGWLQQTIWTYRSKKLQVSNLEWTGRSAVGYRLPWLKEQCS